MSNLKNWVRAEDGIIGGVCLGLARQFDVDVSLIRVAWLISVLFLGTGVLAYFLCVLAFPRTDQLSSAYEKKILGVCARLALRGQIEVGLVRLLALMAFLTTGGLVILAYFVLHFILPWPDASEIKVTKSIL